MVQTPTPVVGGIAMRRLVFLPSERAKAEARWLEARKQLVEGGPLERLAEKTGLDHATLGGMTFPEVFAAVRAKEMEGSDPEHRDRVKHLRFLGAQPDEDDPDAVKVTVQFGPVEFDMPMKREGARSCDWSADFQDVSASACA